MDFGNYLMHVELFDKLAKNKLYSYSLQYFRDYHQWCNMVNLSAVCSGKVSKFWWITVLLFTDYSAASDSTQGIYFQVVECTIALLYVTIHCFKNPPRVYFFMSLQSFFTTYSHRYDSVEELLNAELMLNH